MYKNQKNKNLRLKQFLKLFVRPKQSFGLGSKFLQTTNYKLQTSSGFSLIEVIIGIAVVTVSVVSVVSTYNFFLRVAQKNVQTVKAEFLNEEGLEAVRSIRDTSWSDFVNNISTSTDYFLNFNTNMWEATSTNSYIDDMFERKFVLYDVYRDIGDNIVFSGGDMDLGTKRVEVTVSWSSLGATTTRSSEIILSNLFDN